MRGKMIKHNYTNRKKIVLIFVLSLFTFLMISNTAFAYNWSWDQGHDCVNPIGGSSGWGKYDYDGVFHGGYSSKECCQILCMICPVYANTGALQKTFTDLTVPGVGPSLTIIRTYNSQEWASTLLGHGWLFNFGKQLIITRNNDGQKIVGVLLETGERNFYKEYPDGTLERITAYGATYELIKNSDGTYTIVNRDGTRHELRNDGKVSRIIDKNNNQLTFEYSPIGCLSRITNASGNYVTFQLGPNGKIASVSDNLGRTITYSYDQNGNLISFADPMGNVTQYVYNTNNLLAQIIDPRGNVVESMGYDTNEPPRVSTFTEKGETYTIAYYSDHTVKTDSSGNAWTYYFNDVGVIEKVIDPLGNVKEQSLNKITSTSLDWEKDLNGNQTTYTWDANGNITSKTDPLGNTTAYTYVAGTNWIETETDPRGVVTKYEYDANGNQTKIILDFGGPLENATLYTYDSKGNQTSVTDPLGNSTTYEYDANGNLTKVTDPLGSITTYTYDSRGNKLTETDANGNTTTYAYDLMNRLVSFTDPLGNNITYTYDVNGNRTSETDANGNSRTFVFDTYNRLIQEVDPLGSTTSYAYDSRDNRTMVIDANGNTTNDTYDVLNRLVSETNALLGQTNYTYDAVGNISSITDADVHTTTFNYDGNNRIIKITDASGKTTNFNYDNVGNLISRTDAKGQTVSFAYDTLNRRILTTHPNGSTITLNYNANGNTTKIVDTKTDTDFIYDTMGRLIKLTDNKLNKSISYTYDAVGNKISMIDAEGLLTTYIYDKTNRLDKIIKSMEEVNYNYDKASRQTNVTLPDGTYTTYEYNPNNWLTSLINYKSDGSIISSFIYEYDGVGNRLKTALANGDIIVYAYDKTYKLISETRTGTISYSESFGYDAVGNRIQKIKDGIVTNYIYNEVNQLIQESSNTETIDYTYDDNGNLITKATDIGVNTYSYDYENRMIGFNGPKSSANYSYNAIGNRIAKTVEGVTINFLYDGSNIIAEYDSTNVLQANYLNGIGIDKNISKVINNNTYYYLYDGLGSVRELIDSSQIIQNRYDYRAFGEIISETENVANDYKFSSKRWDRESELYHYWARMYDPFSGRFISKDPLGMIDGTNLYMYALNNPVNLIDLGGMKVSLCTRVLIPRWVVLLIKMQSPLLTFWLPDEVMHCYAKISGNKTLMAYGFGPVDTSWQNKILIGLGVTVNGTIGPDSGGHCVAAKGENNTDDCADECISKAFDSARNSSPPGYNLYRFNCCSWTQSIFGTCGLKMPFYPNNGIGLK